MVLITIIVLLLIFTGAMMIGFRLSKKSPAILSVGQKILKNKETQLEQSPLFKGIRDYREAASKERLAIFIFMMIFLKSVVFFLISLLLIAPVVIFFQGISMGSLLHVVKTRDGQSSELQRVTYWQAVGQATAGGMGTWLGYNWLIGNASAVDWSWFITLDSWIWIAVTVVAGYVAARIEATMIMKEYTG